MKLATRQFLRAVRGDRSQVAFSRRLGYRGNPIADWEAGRRTPTINEALRACDRVGIDVQGAFQRFQASIPVNVFEPKSLAEWLRALRGSTSVVEIAKRSGFSRFTVARWLAARTRPRTHEFLVVLEAITGRACDLVAELVPISSVPALAKAHQARAAARRLAHDEPWTEAILRVLEGHAYRPGAVAQLLDVSPETEQRCIDKLVLAGVIRRRGNRLKVAGELSVDTRAAAQLKAHWAAVGHQRLATPQPGDLFSYNVLSVAPEDLDRIRELLRSTYREIRSVVANSRNTERVALVNLQLVTWSDAAASS